MEELDTVDAVDTAKAIIIEKNFNFLKNSPEVLAWAIKRAEYKELLNHIVLPSFTEVEIHVLLRATCAVIHDPACRIEGLWLRVEDWLFDEECEMDEAGFMFIEKLKGLTFAQEVALLERLEQFRKQRR